MGYRNVDRVRFLLQAMPDDEYKAFDWCMRTRNCINNYIEESKLTDEEIAGALGADLDFVKSIKRGSLNYDLRTIASLETLFELKLGKRCQIWKFDIPYKYSRPLSEEPAPTEEAKE